VAHPLSHHVDAVGHTPSMPSPEPNRSRSWWWLLQLAVSVAVLAALVRAVQPEQLEALPGRVNWGLLLLAMGIKASALLVHDFRVWMVLPSPRPPVLKVAVIGLVSGVVNLVLPGRAGDLVNIGLLRQRCGLGLGTATGAMGIVAFLEAAVFGTLLLTGLTLGAARWEALVGADAHARATQLVGLATGAGLVGVAAVAMVGRRMARSEPVTVSPESEKRPSLLELVRQATTRADAALGSPRNALVNVGVALVQVVAMITSFAIALPAVGVDVSTPFFAAAAVLGLSAIASVVLPPGYGAGPAAASMAVLSTMGATEADVLAYAGAWWVLSQVPAVVLGLPAMWSIGFRFADTHRLQASAPSDARPTS